MHSIKCGSIFQDDRLVLIELDFAKDKRPVPDSLPGIYGIEFAPLVTAWQERANPEAYERHGGRVYPKKYASEYRLAALTDRSYVVANVNNKAIGTITTVRLTTSLLAATDRWN